MQAVGIAAADHEAAGELIDDDDLAVLHDIVDIPLHDAAGGDGLIDVVGQGEVFGVIEALDAEILLRLAGTLGGDGGGAGLFIHDVIGLDILLVVLGVHLLDPQGGESGGEAVGLLIQVSRFFTGAADDEGGTGFIDQNGVHLIDDGVIPAALDAVALIDHHVIAQVIEAEFIIGAVGDIGGVGCPLFIGAHAADGKTDGKAHPAVEIAHPFAVTAGEVFIDGDDMHALAGEGIEVGGQGGNEGFALTGFHFRDAALVQDDAAHDLDGEVTHAQHAVGGLPAGGKGLRQDVIQGFAVRQELLEAGGFSLQGFIIHLTVVVL